MVYIDQNLEIYLVDVISNDMDIVVSAQELARQVEVFLLLCLDLEIWFDGLPQYQEVR